METTVIRERPRATLLLSVLVMALLAGRAVGQTHHEDLDHHLPIDPVDHSVMHHHDGGDPAIDHHFPHHDVTDPHHHVDVIGHDSDPHHDHQFQHHHVPASIHHEDHHHSDGMHHHHVGHYGDIDVDGHVSRADVVLLLRSFGAAGDWNNGDFDGNGLVGLSDLAMLTQNIGTSYEVTPQTSAAAVPEPSSWHLALAGLSIPVFSLWRKRCASMQSS